MRRTSHGGRDAALRTLAFDQSRSVLEETTMTRIRRIRRVAGVLAGVIGALLIYGAASPAALATRVPPGGTAGQVQAPPEVHTVVTGGMAGWQIALIAIGAAVAAAVTAVLLERTQAARRHVKATAA
jgi:hypothetical protein